MKLVELSLLIGAILCSQSLLEFHFGIDYDDTPNLVEKINYFKLYTNFSIGTPAQTVPVYLSFKNYPLYFVDKNNISEPKNYDYKKSSTYEALDTERMNFYMSDYNHGIKSKETFDIGGNKVKDLKFILVDNFTEYEEEASHITNGCLGLRLRYNPYKNDDLTNLQSQLNEKGILKGYEFYLRYDSDHDGTFYMGEITHHLSNNYILPIKPKSRYSINEWSLSFSQIFYGKNVSHENDYTYFTLKSGFLKASNSFKEVIMNGFFNQYLAKKVCQKEKFLKKYKTRFYITCNSDFDIKKLENVVFFDALNNYNFTFTYEDLFQKSGDRWLFLIAFSENEKDYWKFGKPFFKKYHLVFDRQEKLMKLILNPSKLQLVNLSNSFNPLLFAYVVLFGFIFNVILYILNKKVQKKNKNVQNNGIFDENYVKYYEELTNF